MSTEQLDALNRLVNSPGVQALIYLMLCLALLFIARAIYAGSTAMATRAKSAGKESEADADTQTTMNDMARNNFKRVSELSEKNAQLEKQVNENALLLQQLKRDLEDYRRDLTSANADRELLREKVTNLTTKVEELQEQVRVRDSQNNFFEGENQRLHLKIQELENKLANCETKAPTQTVQAVIVNPLIAPEEA